MIPKIIHYCWLSNDPIPQNLLKCMDSWKTYLPDYSLMLWNFDRFPHGKSKWVDEAYAKKKYAFAADYIRLYALYNYGGIYLDMDVEVCKSFDSLLNLKTVLCWQRSIGGLEVAAFGVEKKCSWIRECLDKYDVNSFIKEDLSFDMQPLPNKIESYLKMLNYTLRDVNSIDEALLVEQEKCIPIFPCEYFSPKSYLTGKIKKTRNTFCIHHFASSWVQHKEKSLIRQIKDFIWKTTGLADLQIKKKILKKKLSK